MKNLIQNSDYETYEKGQRKLHEFRVDQHCLKKSKA